VKCLEGAAVAGRCTASKRVCMRAETVHDVHSPAAGADSGGVAAGQASMPSDAWAPMRHSSILPQHLQPGPGADQQPHQGPGPMPSPEADPVIYPSQSALSMARRMSQPEGDAPGTCALGDATSQGQGLEAPTSAAKLTAPAPASQNTLRLRGRTSADESAVTLAADDRTRTLERAMDRAMLFWSAGTHTLASLEEQVSATERKP